MTGTYVSEGQTIQHTAAATIAAGDVVAIGEILGVALVDIAIGETGSVAIEGVFTVPKVSAAVILQGESLVWDSSASEFDDNAATPAAGDVSGAPAVAWGDYGAAVTSMQVKFTGVPGTVT